VALGSAEDFDVSVPSRCLERLYDVLPAICRRGQPTSKLHGLRMLNPRIVAYVPLSTADSTNVARNISIDKNWASGAYPPATLETRAVVLTELTERCQPPARLSEGMARQREAARAQGTLWD
jgi:hypothetical protein